MIMRSWGVVKVDSCLPLPHGPSKRCSWRHHEQMLFYVTLYIRMLDKKISYSSRYVAIIRQVPTSSLLSMRHSTFEQHDISKICQNMVIKANMQGTYSEFEAMDPADASAPASATLFPSFCCWIGRQAYSRKMSSPVTLFPSFCCWIDRQTYSWNMSESDRQCKCTACLKMRIHPKDGMLAGTCLFTSEIHTHKVRFASFGWTVN